MDDHQAHEQRRDAVFESEAECDRRDNRNCARADRADRRQDSGDPEHDPRDCDDPTSYASDRQPDEPVNRAVILGNGEEKGDPDQGQEQAARKAGDDSTGGLARHQGSDQECSDEREHPHVDRQDRSHHEHGNKRVD
jgi:hypothetical protein